MLISIPVVIKKIGDMSIDREDSFIVDVHNSNDDEICVHIYTLQLRIHRNDLAEVLGILNMYYRV
jgi:hypothetical protein